MRARVGGYIMSLYNFYRLWSWQLKERYLIISFVWARHPDPRSTVMCRGKIIYIINACFFVVLSWDDEYCMHVLLLRRQFILSWELQKLFLSMLNGACADGRQNCVFVELLQAVLWYDRDSWRSVISFYHSCCDSWRSRYIILSFVWHRHPDPRSTALRETPSLRGCNSFLEGTNEHEFARTRVRYCTT